MKKLLITMLCVFALFVLIACGDTTTKESSDQGTAAPSTETTDQNETEKEEERHYAEEFLKIEEIVYEQVDEDWINICFKVRNLTDMKLKDVILNTSTLDENGDILDTSFCADNNAGLSPDQAIWIEYQDNESRSSGSPAALAEHYKTLEVTGIQISEEGSDEGSSDYYFKDSIKIDIASLKER